MDAPLQGIVFLFEEILYHGKIRNQILRQGQVQKHNIG